MNPGVSRLALVIALVIGGVALLANGFSDGETVAAPRDSSSPSPSETPSPARSPQQSIVPNQQGVLVQVLNGTTKPGLAADFQATLVDQGGYLEAGTPGDAPDKPVVDSVVYFRQDNNKAQNRADAQLLSETYLGGIAVKPLPAALKDVVSASADVIVVLGEDQAGV
jgi:LytR cell envelope-related transcriptional attenuator